MRLSLTLTLLSVLGFSLTHGEVNIHFHLKEAEDHGTDYSADDKGGWGSKNDSCATVNNARCVFPFKFQNQVFVGCTEVGAVDGKAWCSTRTNQEGHHVGGAGNWGQCSSNCPQDLHQSSITLWSPVERPAPCSRRQLSPDIGGRPGCYKVIKSREPCTIRWLNRGYQSSRNYRETWVFEDGKVNGITRCENTKGNKATGFTINRAEKGTFIYFSDYPIDSNVWWLDIINLNGYKDLLTIEVKKTINQPRKYRFKEFEEADISDGWVEGKYKKQFHDCLANCGLSGEISYAMVTDRKLEKSSPQFKW